MWRDSFWAFWNVTWPTLTWNVTWPTLVVRRRKILLRCRQILGRRGRWCRQLRARLSRCGHDSFPQKCDMTRCNMWHDSLLWLIHTWHDSDIYVGCVYGSCHILELCQILLRNGNESCHILQWVTWHFFGNWVIRHFVDHWGGAQNAAPIQLRLKWKHGSFICNSFICDMLICDSNLMYMSHTWLILSTHMNGRSYVSNRSHILQKRPIIFFKRDL